MIIGIGTDLIEIERIRKACSRQAFLIRCFTAPEREMIGTLPLTEGRGTLLLNDSRAAGNFAVKEAVSKVLGTGFRGFSLCDIEVLRDDLGKPYVNLYGGAGELAEKLGIRKIHVSITNSREYAVGFAVGEGD